MRRARSVRAHGARPRLFLLGLVIGVAWLSMPVVLRSQPSRSQASGTSTTSRPVAAPPYYRGEIPREAAVAGHLPVSLAAPHEALPREWAPVAAVERLASEMTAWLARRGETVPLGAIEISPRSAPPRVYLGCALDPLGECVEEPRQNVLETTSATKAWREALATTAGEAGVDRALVLELDLAPHWIHQRNLKGAKEVRLGTGYSQSLPWLTSLDTPVFVLQVSGALVGADGKILRSGGEGLVAVRTPFRASILGAQKLMSEEDVERVRTELRRTDLPGSPLVWQAALAQLVDQLLGAGAPE